MAIVATKLESGWPHFSGSKQRITDVHNDGTVELVRHLVSTLCMQSIARERNAINHNKLIVQFAFLRSTR
ncbi:hypothetical protein MPTK1_2g06040 [Marchantia polymorpha subsp. ruderalis]|uniref:Uncharacterized protein n=1 Tax=Marchantia polymorpha TaxID=3197 RepID=A0A2R6XDL3_MARPO|nr:hypothetical protein MARPO_0021s0059 [Marchantia polymorpha]BBN01268.1 hypothetical protein Mp_2g06040 [Marchantia polymorpha subsp. ruderalis]|eukprot:PTQ44193.1 hypothetical protein MARPO_0021s0059 [Marchantia polymorpha]